MSTEVPPPPPTDEVMVVKDRRRLAEYGVCQVPIPTSAAVPGTRWQQWAQELSQVTPQILAMEGVGQYAFYRNILEEPDFPFDLILNPEISEIAQAILRHFHVSTVEPHQEIRLDDAFCIHYNTSQEDSSGAKHTDPSDITVNMCLERSEDLEGSQVMFYGTKALHNLTADTDYSGNSVTRFLVEQEEGYATVHWGNHPHETLPLLRGRRTNIVLTYCYVDKTKSDVASRTCYF